LGRGVKIIRSRKEKKPWWAMEYALPRTTKTTQINFAHFGSLSMALEMALVIGPMIAILSENKPARYFFLYGPAHGF
jgi:hypothetical protein